MKLFVKIRATPHVSLVAIFLSAKKMLCSHCVATTPPGEKGVGYYADDPPEQPQDLEKQEYRKRITKLYEEKNPDKVMSHSTACSAVQRLGILWQSVSRR